MSEDRQALCPRCHNVAEWALTERYRLGEHSFSERVQMCPVCLWHGPVALFPWLDNPELPLHVPQWTAQPLDDARPMLPPGLIPGEG